MRKERKMRKRRSGRRAVLQQRASPSTRKRKRSKRLECR
jgi:hypothetical protein